jgi:hypothetical protein
MLPEGVRSGLCLAGVHRPPDGGFVFKYCKKLQQCADIAFGVELLWHGWWIGGFQADFRRPGREVENSGCPASQARQRRIRDLLERSPRNTRSKWDRCTPSSFAASVEPAQRTVRSFDCQGILMNLSEWFAFPLRFVLAFGSDARDAGTNIREIRPSARKIGEFFGVFGENRGASPHFRNPNL